MDQSEEQIEIVLTIHVSVEDEYVDLDIIEAALRGTSFQNELEYALQRQMEEHHTNRVGSSSIENFEPSDAFSALWRGGFGVDARADAWRRGRIDQEPDWEEF